jgi:FKBP-type peptidyl-prolyl cis-trans isomerase SlyD
MSAHDHSHDHSHDHDEDHDHPAITPQGRAEDGFVTTQCVVALTWIVKDGTNELLDELEDPVEFMVGGDDLLPSIDLALQGHKQGDTVDIHLEPEQAFGAYDEGLVFLEDRKNFPENLEPGMLFEGLPAGCNPDAPQNILYTVDDIYPEHVVLEGNHPLAGMALKLKAKIVAVREANVEEVGRGSCGAGFFKIVPQAPGSAAVH